MNCCSCASETRNCSSPRLARQQALVDELLEDREAHLGVVEHRRVEVAAHHLPRMRSLLLAQRLGRNPPA